MTEAERDEGAPLFPQKAGELLRATREERGITLAEVAHKTRVPIRHLESIEQSRYELLPAPAYATGFAKAYAREVGVDEVDIARRVRAEAAEVAPLAQPYTPYVTADPKRLPSRMLALTAAGVAIAILVAAALWLAASRLGGGGETEPPAPLPSASTPPASTPAPASAGKVRLEAIGEVWVRVHDATRTLFLRVMKPGDAFDVPASADHPLVDVGRPDKLRVTLNGAALAPLGDGDRAAKDVAIDPASLAARAPAPTPSAAPSATSTPRPHSSPSATRAHREADEDDAARANRGAPTAEPSAAPTASPPPAPATPAPTQ